MLQAGRVKHCVLFLVDGRCIINGDFTTPRTCTRAPGFARDASSVEQPRDAPSQRALTDGRIQITGKRIQQLHESVEEADWNILQSCPLHTKQLIPFATLKSRSKWYTTARLSVSQVHKNKGLYILAKNTGKAVFST